MRRRAVQVRANAFKLPSGVGIGPATPGPWGLLPLIAILVVWQVSGGDAPFLLPPGDWVSAVKELFISGDLGAALWETFTSFVLSLVVIIIVGVGIGYLLGRVWLADTALTPTLEFIRFTPSSAIVPLAVVFMGFVGTMTVVVAVIGAVWPVLLQTRAAAKSVPVARLDVARSVRMGRLRTLWKVILPSLTPGIVLGVRIATPTTLILVLLVEMLTNIGGVGRLIAIAQESHDVASLYGLVTVAAILAITVNSVLIAVGNAILRARHLIG